MATFISQQIVLNTKHVLYVFVIKSYTQECMCETLASLWETCQILSADGTEDFVGRL